MLFFEITETNRVLIESVNGSYPDQKVAAHPDEKLFLVVEPGRECRILPNYAIARMGNVRGIQRKFYFKRK